MKTVFETIKDRLPITEVLSSYITVTQSGAQYKAKCPFHNERTASFYISPDRGLYYCFGCGAKGDIFSFVEQFEGLDKSGALKLLAERAGVSLSEYQQGTQSDTDGLYRVLEKATLQYQGALQENKEAEAYLTKRGLLKETIEAFRIGYAPDEWRFIESACADDGEKKNALRAGLLTKNNDGKIYDRFRKRIMFPLSDSSGRVIGFSGRVFPEDKTVAKYINSPETEIFKKSKVLFGFDKAKFHIRKHNFAILVEGQMDLVISHQAGFRNTVASSGTAVSEEAANDDFSNLASLARLSTNLFLAFDGDEAGQKAMDRAALVALSLGMNPKVVSLPKGIDPADFIREKGPDAWKALLKESRHFIEHHLILVRKAQYSPHLFVKTIKEKIFPFLARVSSSMEKNLYINQIAGETGLSPQAIADELSKLTQGKELATISQRASEEISPYERLVVLLREFPSEHIQASFATLTTVAFGDYVFSAPAIDTKRLDTLSFIIKDEYKNISETDREKIAQELIDRVIETFQKSAYSSYAQLLREAEKDGNEAEVIRITTILKEIHNFKLKRESA